MKIPVIKGVIRRRVLLNYRVNPEVVQAILPSGFRPKLYKDFAVAGICLIRLEQIRPSGFPAFVGISSENSAHRIAVEWDENGTTKEGVFVPRRDTGSMINSLAGGRIFPGHHYHSDFLVTDNESEVSMKVVEKGHTDPLLKFAATESDQLPESSIFEHLDDSSNYFEAGCIGFSSCPGSTKLEGLILNVINWTVSPLAVTEIASQYFDDRNIFPDGSIQFDHALLMRDIDHEWHSCQPPV